MTQTLTPDTFTNEQLRDIAEGAMLTQLQDKIMARELLANREAQPVAVTDEMALAFHRALNDGGIGEADLEEIKVGLRGALCNITAPPAPAVPDEKTITPFFDTIALDTAKMVICDVNRRSDFLGGDIQLLARIQCRIDEACRAAMLAAAPKGGN